MHFIDSHAHLADPAFDSDREQVLERALSSGAQAVICIGESLSAAARARSFAAVHPGVVFHTVGIHPHDAATFDAGRDVPLIESELRAGAVAVGECGFDYHYDNAPATVQRDAVNAQLELARQYRRPMVVHSRDAEDDTRSLLRDAGRLGVNGVLHCFTGSHALARAALEAGWYISFSGMITFKSWTDGSLLRFIPDDRLLAESDSPFLAPVPYRGKRNEPAWVSLTVARLASERQVSVDQVGEFVAANACDLFGITGYPQAG